MALLQRLAGHQLKNLLQAEFPGHRVQGGLAVLALDLDQDQRGGVLVVAAGLGQRSYAGKVAGGEPPAVDAYFTLNSRLVFFFTATFLSCTYCGIPFLYGG